ncbi:MAG: hypothetical protein KIY11_02620 [Thermoplasmata archaeon]|nr:hypothetical protein [Candidatus Sysuiplasma acidicola]
MTTDRRFCSFARGGRSGLGIDEIPEDGFRISVFLIIRESETGRRVLMGHMNPAGPWDHIGALDSERVKVHSRGWMFPSCHLMYGEAPYDCARRIAEEQLNNTNIRFSVPAVYSEVYKPKRFPGLRHHWDLEFLYAGIMSRNDVLRTEHAWLDMEFVDIDATPSEKIARSHEDIMEHLK